VAIDAEKMDELTAHSREAPRLIPEGIAALKAVRRAVADLMAKLDPLQARLAFIAAKASRVRRDLDRQTLQAECREIEETVSEVRTELILRLMDAPPQIAGHSRILDIEKALDSIARSLKQTRRVLSHVSQVSGRAS
jgi:hypothetical protein